MESAGIMERIKGLLEEGKYSGELIKMGFAPGTVYKVQRQFRRQAHMGQGKISELQAIHTPEIPSPPSPDVLAMVDRLQQCQNEKASLQSELERLQEVEEEVNLTKTQLAALKYNLEFERAEKIRLDIKITQLISENERLTQHLQEVNTENLNLKNYLRSKNCCWKQDFSAFKARSRVNCSLQSCGRELDY